MGFEIAQSTANKTSTSTQYKSEAQELHGTLQDQEVFALNLPRRQFRHTRWSTASALPPSTSNMNLRSQQACQQRPTLSRPPSRPSITQTDATKDLPGRPFRHNKIHHSNQTSGRRHANQADKSTAEHSDRLSRAFGSRGEVSTTKCPKSGAARHRRVPWLTTRAMRAVLRAGTRATTPRERFIVHKDEVRLRTQA